jgi:hypothetical protein
LARTGIVLFVSLAAASIAGTEGGITMVIEFTWEVHDDEHITGELHSTVSQQGMTCEMSRDYELNFSN